MCIRDRTGGGLTVGAPADITLLAPDLMVEVAAASFRSKSRNTPFDGWTLRGAVAATMMRGNSSGTGLPTSTTLVEQMARGNVFAGTPDQVYDQIRNFYEYCGGFGNLMMMSQAGFMTFDETLASMKLFSEDVYPRLKELTSNYDAGQMREIRAGLPNVENVNVSSLASEFVR